MLTTLYLRHESGATHALTGRRLAKLRREIAAGSAAEVNRWLASGYVGYLGLSGELEALDGEALAHEFAQPPWQKEAR